MTKDLQNKIIKKFKRIHVIPESADIFYPMVHINDEESLIIEPIEDFYKLAVIKYSKIILIKHDDKRLFFGIRNVD